MLQNFPDPQLQERHLADLRVLVVGTTCCDMTNPEFNFLEDIAGDGLVVDKTRMVPVRPEWLETKEHSYAMGGGSLNIAPLVSRTGIRTGILTSLGIEGKAYDIQGRFMLNIMEKTGTIPLIIPSPDQPSAVSFIRPSRSGRREAILHAPNAVDDLDLEKKQVFNVMTRLPRGAIIHYVYSGASRTMDSEEGEKLARVMERLKKQGYMTTVDPHTLSKNPQESIRTGEIIEGYNLLKPVLPHLSWFFASEAEAMMMANTFGFSLPKKSGQDKAIAFLHNMAVDFRRYRSPRIFGVTAGTTATLMALNPEGKKVGPLSVESRYIIDDADKFVGAGDSFRAGFETEWIKGSEYPEKFRTGRITDKDLERLCHAGHLMAACYVTRTPLSQYGNIPVYKNMVKVIESGLSFSEKESLFSTLDIKQSQ